MRQDHRKRAGHSICVARYRININLLPWFSRRYSRPTRMCTDQAETFRVSLFRGMATRKYNDILYGHVRHGSQKISINNSILNKNDILPSDLFHSVTRFPLSESKYPCIVNTHHLVKIQDVSPFCSSFAPYRILPPRRNNTLKLVFFRCIPITK